MKMWQSTTVRSNKPETPCLLVGDIGGTNARFALGNPQSPGFSKEMTLKCRDYESADIAINAYLKKTKAHRPIVICIAAAGPVVDGNLRITNNNWNLNVSELQKSFSDASIRLLNDFEAIAYSIPHLAPDDCLSIGLPAPVDLAKTDFTVGIVGPGTGLGAAGLCKKDGQIVPIIGEGGHIGFAPESHVQMELLSQLRNQFDRVCDERLVSGPGVVNIYRALSNIRGDNIADITAAEIFSLAAQTANGTARESVEIFYEILGQVAGNLALTLGAFDGVYIGGGIVARKPDLIINSRFRTGFERKGRHRSLMEKTPTQVILHPQPGLLGASYCALQML
jgi:glucokinase